MTRQYQMKVRAERHADTRRRILAAATYLQRTVGPQHTTISEVARLAGVERPTVARHFPDRITLFMACNQGDPVPESNASAWAREPDPEVRLSRALTEQYAWFRRNRALAKYLLEILADDSLSSWRELMWRQRSNGEQVLAEGWQASDSSRPRLLLAIRHALSFWAWYSLSESGLTDDEAAGLMFDFVLGVASNQIWKRWSGNKASLGHDRLP